MQPLHALVLAALLLAAQGLGLAHRAVHGQGGGGPQAAHAADAGHAVHGGHAAAWLDGHDDGSANCRLIDQLGHADLAFGTPLGLLDAPAGAAAVPGCTTPAQGRTPSRAYQARAPPQEATARA